MIVWCNLLLVTASLISFGVSIWYLVMIRRFRRLNALMLALCLQAFELRGFPLLHLLSEASRKERR